MRLGRFLVRLHSRFGIGAFIVVRFACEMKAVADVAQRFEAGLFDFEDPFLDLLDRVRACFFDLVGEPIPFDDVEDDHARHHDEEQRDADLLVVTENGLDRAAEEISDTAQDQNPERAADRVKGEEPKERHLARAVEHTHSDAYAVNIFRDYDRKAAELVDKFLDTRLGQLIESVAFDRPMKSISKEITERVAHHCAERAEDKDLQEAIVAKETAVCEDAGEQESNVTFDHTECKNRVNSVGRNNVVKVTFHRRRNAARKSRMHRVKLGA